MESIANVKNPGQLKNISYSYIYAYDFSKQRHILSKAGMDSSYWFT